MMKPVARLASALALCASLVPPVSAGGGGNTWAIPIQAELKSAAGVPINGNVHLAFSLYNSPSGGTAYWTEFRDVIVTAGLLNTSLGQVTPVPDPFLEPAYLGIQVGTDPEMTPRLLMTAAPYALRLPNVYTFAGMVGIGTASPATTLDIISHDQATMRLYSVNGSAPTILLNRTAASGFAPGSLGALNFGLNGNTWGSIGANFATGTNDGLLFGANYGQVARLMSPGLFELHSSVGDKLVLYRAADGISTVGMGVQGNLLQVHSDTNVSDIAFGYGSSDNLTETVRFSHLGRVGIGTTAPAFPLDIASPGQAVIRMQSAATGYGSVIELRNNSAPQTMIGAINFPHNTDGTIGQIAYLSGHQMVFTIKSLEAMRITDYGRVGINQAVPMYMLDVGGSINASSSVRAAGVLLTSDARYKQHVSTLDGALDKVLALRGVAFDWNRQAWPKKDFPEGRQVGFVAQEVEKVLPEVVSAGADGYKGVAYQNIVPVLVEAIKSQQKQIDEMKAQVERLTAK
ncbi:MAG TPA: tail fiber domain-containing protein [Armatimonadota bacterium]|jgi:hypothetical protein